MLSNPLTYKQSHPLPLRHPLLPCRPSPHHELQHPSPCSPAATKGSSWAQATGASTYWTWEIPYKLPRT